MDPARIPIRASTQQHLDIDDIREDIVIFKNGSCCLILQISAVNFDLLSEIEQEATIRAYAGLLNSLSFPIQINVRSQKKDISSYLILLKQQIKKQSSSQIREQIKKYQQFVEKIVQENEVLDKKFYIIVPFSTLELGVQQTLKAGLLPKKGLSFSKQQILEKAKTNLYPKRDHLLKQFARLGLKAIQLNTQELIKLFYDIYNPQSEGQKLTSAQEYASFIVERESSPSPSAPAPTKPTAKSSPASAPSAPPPSTPAPATPGSPPLEGGRLQEAINKMVKKTAKKQ